MNRFKLIPIFCLTVLAGLQSSCTKDFSKINTPTNIPESIPLGSLFLEMQNMVYPAQNNNYQMSENLIGDVYGRYFAISNTWTTNFGTYNAPDSWLNSPYTDAYAMFYPAYNKVQKETNGEGVFFQWAQLLKVGLFHRITDMYGPIPYSKVGSTGDYDSQEQVYTNMFNDLDKAIQTLTEFVNVYPNDRSMAQFDNVYGGDFVKWIKFANSLKLRLAMRIAYANPDLAKQKAEEAVSHLIGVIQDNADNASIRYNPNPIKVMWDDYSDSRVAADIVTYMKGYNDPRISKYFQTTSKVYTTGEGYYGLRVGINIPSKDWATRYSTPAIYEGDRLLWMNASEIAFLKSEGALRGWAMGATAEALYNTGIELSFAQHNVSNALSTYISNTTLTQANNVDPTYPANALSKITIKWNEAGSFETKLEQIMTQKWIAIYPLGQEAWSEQRRTGYPRFFPIVLNRNANESALTKDGPSRIPFAPNEKILNLEKYNAGVQLLGGPDNYSTKLWWDKNQNKPLL